MTTQNKHSEQRQSIRFSREFMVTDHEDIDFQQAFTGHDVNLTGLSFWVDNCDWLLPGQPLSLRIKNQENGEEYCLDGVEVIHLQNKDKDVLCGCHITHVSSDQLLAHNRIVVSDQQSAQLANPISALEDYDFDEEGGEISADISDFQEVVMAQLLQFEQLKKDYRRIKNEWAELGIRLECLEAANLEKFSALETLGQLETSIEQAFHQQMAWALYAKLIAFSPSEKFDRQSWQTMTADFEDVHLSELQQAAFDFIHQGVNARKALAMARDLVLAQGGPQLEIDTIEKSKNLEKL